MLDKKGLAICDGVSSPADLSSVFYVLYIVSGLVIFITIMLFYNEIKDKILGGK